MRLSSVQPPQRNAKGQFNPKPTVGDAAKTQEFTSKVRPDERLIAIWRRCRDERSKVCVVVEGRPRGEHLVEGRVGNGSMAHGLHVLDPRIAAVIVRRRGLPVIVVGLQKEEIVLSLLVFEFPRVHCAITPARDHCAFATVDTTLNRTS